jgi:arginase
MPHSSGNKIQIISAPSILGLKPTGVERLPTSLLDSGLREHLGIKNPVIHVPTLNNLYSDQRDDQTKCLNSHAIALFSRLLGRAVTDTIDENRFPLVLGGDCSILLGICSALKIRGTFGLLFMDAHADFYEPEKSLTGEVADMDLAIITGRGPSLLTNIDNQQPYLSDENVIHIGQRDQEEARVNGSQDIWYSEIHCFPLRDFETRGTSRVLTEILDAIRQSTVRKFWLHFDTDVLSDEVNPAVDYRLPGGLGLDDAEEIISSLLATGKVVGASVTIFNPTLDTNGQITQLLVQFLGRALSGLKSYNG